jgi:hypothetical protein
MEKKQLWLVLEYFQEAQLLPSGDDAAFTWADGLGSTQTTPWFQRPGRPRANCGS